MMSQAKSKKFILVKLAITVSLVVRVLSEFVPAIIYNEGFNALELLILLLFSAYYIAFMFFAYGKKDRIPLIAGYVLLAVVNGYSLMRCLRSLMYYPSFSNIEWLIETLVLIASHIVLLVSIIRKSSNRTCNIIASAVSLGFSSLGVLFEIILIIKGQAIFYSLFSQLGVAILEFGMFYYFKNTDNLKYELRIAKKRFDSGEITADEYGQLKESILNRL